MALVRTRKIIDDAGADAVLAAAEQVANAHGHRVVIAVVDPYGELDRSCGARRARRSRVASGGRQGSHRRDLRAAEPRDGGAGHERSPRRAGAARRACLTGGIPLEGRRRGRRSDRHERRDPGRGRGRLDRRRRGGVLDLGGPRAHVRGREARGGGGRRRGRRARRRAGGLGRRRRRRADVPRPARRRPGRARRGDHRQGAHGGDLPPAEQGLRGPGLRRPAFGAPPRPRGAASGRRADRVRRRGDRRRSA